MAGKKTHHVILSQHSIYAAQHGEGRHRDLSAVKSQHRVLLNSDPERLAERSKFAYGTCHKGADPMSECSYECEHIWHVSCVSRNFKWLLGSLPEVAFSLGHNNVSFKAISYSKIQEEMTATLMDWLEQTSQGESHFLYSRIWTQDIHGGILIL